MKNIRKIKTSKFRLQGGRCFYCCQPMWCENQTRFAEEFGLPSRKARYLQATAEHLVARCAGGDDTEDNIVVACWYCNTHRHYAKRPLAPEAYGHKVRSSLSRGRWHGFKLDAPDD